MYELRADVIAGKQAVSLDFVHCMWCKEQTFPFFFSESHDVISVIENNLLKLLFTRFTQSPFKSAVICPYISQ